MLLLYGRLLVSEAGYYMGIPSVGSDIGKYAEDYEFGGQSGVLAVTILTRRISTGEMANGRVQCYWGTEKLHNCQSKHQRQPLPKIRLSSTAMKPFLPASAFIRKKQKPFSPNKNRRQVSLQRTLRRCIYETAGAEAPSGNWRIQVLVDGNE